MTHKEVIKELESIGVEIDYMQVDPTMLEEECQDSAAFRGKLLSAEESSLIDNIA